ncbi:hypothetical protein F8568_027595 [Actinomadura sp. LD22]|uniref:Uncharacterized protein n=1 Tax=Actinomadura physcomitrii TaxID=2650748 RepID=A0A6I4MGR4_9ACTN|nr:hypothetical protein [Actinomadura physcomitrii]MWA04080.1 hypothetical protein [Actinomadura physcomitrii]
MSEPTADGGARDEEPEGSRAEAGEDEARRRERPDESEGFSPTSPEGRGGALEDLSPDDFE